VKKQKKILENKISGDAVYSQQGLAQDLASVQPADPEDVVSLQDQHPLHPPFNVDGKTVAEAYPRSGIIPDVVWKAISVDTLLADVSKPEALQVMESKPDMWPAFVMQKLQVLPTAAKAKTEYLKQLRFLSYLVRFGLIGKSIKSELGTDRATRRTEAKEHPEAVKAQIDMTSWAYILHHFTEEKRDSLGSSPGGPLRIMTDNMRQKLILHSLALALIIAEGTLPVASMHVPLRLTEQKCTFYLRQLGCTIQAQGGTKTAVLALPLVFPKVSRGAPQRK